jgi:hypothetical protein
MSNGYFNEISPFLGLEINTFIDEWALLHAHFD